jgi:hypothetical protein
MKIYPCKYNFLFFIFFHYLNFKIFRLVDSYLIVFLPSTFVFIFNFLNHNSIHYKKNIKFFYSKFYTFSIILSKYLQAQNIINPLTVINFIAVTLNCILHSIFIYAFEWGIK